MKKHETKKINWIKIAKHIIIWIQILFSACVIFTFTIAGKLYPFLQVPLKESIEVSILFGLNIAFLIGIIFNKWSLIGHAIITLTMIILIFNGYIRSFTFLLGPILLFAIMYKEFFAKYH